MAQRRKSSVLWNHFEETQPKVAKCNYCTQTISITAGSLGNLNRHLSRKHPTITITNHNNKETTYTSSQPTDSSTDTDLDLELPVSIIQSKSITSNTQLKINYFTERTKPMPLSKKQQIDKQLVTMIAKEYHPLRLVEEAEFKKLIHLLSPSYNLPTRKTLSESLLPQLYLKLHEDARNKMDKAQAICLTTDGWTSKNNQSFLAVTAHYIDPETMNMNSYLLSCIEYNRSHTAENLADFLKNVIQEWKIENKVGAIVSDHAANILAAVKLGGWRSIGCFAHLLNLNVQSAILQISSVVQEVKSVVEYFERSSKALEKLHEMQKQMELPLLKLKQDVPTRWNSTYEMLERVFQIKNAIIATLALMNNKISLSSDDWIVIEEVLPILKVFFNVTVEICSEKNVSLSKVIVFCDLLRDHVDQYLVMLDNKMEVEKTNALEIVNNLLESLHYELFKRLNDIEKNFLYAESTILDPRFKRKGFRDEINSVKAIDGLKLKIRNSQSEPSRNIVLTHFSAPISTDIVPTTPSSSIHPQSVSIWDKFDQKIASLTPQNSAAAAIVELDKYINEPNLNRQEDPLRWWYSRKNVYPILFKFIFKRLNLVATSVPCECIFSKAGMIQNEKRSRLSATELCLSFYL